MAGEKTFLFNSGGKDHPSGFGEWDIILDAEGRISITHFVGDEIYFSGMGELNSAQTKELWDLVNDLDLKNLKFPDRSLVPDEVTYTFSYKEGDEEYELKVLANDASTNDVLKKFLVRIKEIIHITSGKEAII